METHETGVAPGKPPLLGILTKGNSSLQRITMILGSTHYEV